MFTGLRSHFGCKRMHIKVYHSFTLEVQYVKECTQNYIIPLHILNVCKRLGIIIILSLF